MSDAKNVFGQDDRVAVRSGFPWQAVGRLSNGCTGSMIGRRLVLTAAHCIFDKNGNIADGTSTFNAGYSDRTIGTASRWQHVWYGTKFPSGSGRAHDWAILLLTDPIGNSTGWLGAKKYVYRGNDVITVGGYSTNYLNGSVLSVHSNCNARGLDGSLLQHDCDTGRGASGGPILGYFYENGKNVPYIIGVNAAERRNGGEKSLYVEYYHRNYANIGVPSTQFFDTLLDLTRRYN